MRAWVSDLTFLVFHVLICKACVLASSQGFKETGIAKEPRSWWMLSEVSSARPPFGREAGCTFSKEGLA